MVYEATVENASFGLVGSQRNWGNSNPGRLLNTILATRVGNPVVVVDEVEKSGRAESNKGHQNPKPPVRRGHGGLVGGCADPVFRSL